MDIKPLLPIHVDPIKSRLVLLVHKNEDSSKCDEDRGA